MPKRRSIIVDEIMRDYYRDLKWKNKVAKMKEEKEKKEQDINNTR